MATPCTLEVICMWYLGAEIRILRSSYVYHHSIVGYGGHRYVERGSVASFGISCVELSVLLPHTLLFSMVIEHTSAQLHNILKLKLSHYTPRRRLGEWRYSSYSFSMSVAPRKLFSPGKNPRYPLDTRLCGPQSRSGHRGYKKKLFRLCRGSNLDRPVVHPVSRHYTDWATRLNLN
jgi:hypothetical protein